jgi:hypothetical protein
MNNNDQHSFKDAAAVFETLENDQPPLERVIRNEVVKPAPATISNVTQKHTFRNALTTRTHTPSLLIDMMVASGFVMVGGFLLFGVPSLFN